MIRAEQITARDGVVMNQNLTYKPIRWIVVFLVALGFKLYQHIWLVVAVCSIAAGLIDASSWCGARRELAGSLDPSHGNSWLFVVFAMVGTYLYFVKKVRYELPTRKKNQTDNDELPAFLGR